MTTTAPKAPSPAAEAPTDPDLPRLVQVGDILAPAAPAELADLGMDENVLGDLVLKLAATVPQLTTSWAAQQLHLPVRLTELALDRLRTANMLEVLGQSGIFGYRYTVTQRGRDHAVRLMDISGYVGPVPVSLAAYRALLDWQLGHYRPPSPDEVADALAELVLQDEQATIAGLAISSGRSLFLSGPPGNGKTSVGKLLHRAQFGELWVPHAIAIGGNIIRYFDAQCHTAVGLPNEPTGVVDQRWVRIRRPLMVVGGELTLESVDLVFSPSQRYYEAPIQLKANGGTLLIDDFGRQRFDPHRLLNRWIIPLEHGVDFLTLNTGQKIQVPFRQMLIISTNLDPETTMDPAFLRRMGYRLYLDGPSAEQYTRIFRRSADRAGVRIEPRVISRLIDRYKAEGRPLRGSEPRDLIERSRDICTFGGMPLSLDEEVLDLAWAGYFGTIIPRRPNLAEPS